MKTHKSDLKQVSLSSSIMAAIGITEPALFGVLIPTKHALIAPGVVTAICSAISLIIGVQGTALSLCGLGGIPAYLGSTFVPWLILIVAAFAGGTAISYFLTGDDK